jgi:PA14 domain
VLSSYAAVTVLSLVLFAPQMPAIYNNWSAFTSRMRTVSVLHVPLPWEHHESRVALMKDNLINAILSVTQPINNTRRYAAPARPLVHPLAGLLLALGMFTSLWDFRRHIWWWLMLVVPLVFTQVLTTQIPHAARGIAIAPVLFYFAGVGLDVLHPYWYGFGQRRVPIAVMLLCLIAVWGDLHLYHEWIAAPATLDDRGPAVSMAEFPYWTQWQINRLRKNGLKTGSMEEWEKNREEIIRWIAANPERQAELAPPTERQLQVRGRPPGAPVESVSEQPNAEEQLASAGVGPDTAPTPSPIIREELAARLRQIAKTPVPVREARDGAFNSPKDQGVEVTYYQGKDWFGPPTDQGWATDLTLRAVPEREVSIRWRATLSVPQSGTYRFVILSDDGAELNIDGKVVVTDLASHSVRAAASVIDLAAGEHPLELRYWQGGGLFALVLFWQPPGEDWGPIPAAVLAAPKE